MKNLTTAALVCVLLTICSGADWRQFRGPDYANSTTGKLPAEFDSTAGIAWTAELPGRGLSGPIVVGDRIFVTSCTGINQDRLHVLCFDTATGTQLWHRQFWATGLTMTHPKTNTAAPTPASDGERIYALFSTNDVFCLDLDGNLIWLRGLAEQYPNASNSLGLASSPTLVDNTLVVQLETDSESVAVGLDSQRGHTRWQQPRPKQASWTTPTVVQRPNGNQLIALQSATGMTALDPASGQIVWEYAQRCASQPSTASNGSVTFVPSDGLVALRDNGTSPEPEVLWKNNKLAPSTPSPLLRGDRLYVVNKSVLKCGNAIDGELLWQMRLDGTNFTSSPVAAGNYIYVFEESGKATVVEDGGSEGRIVGGGNLNETILCTPAIANNALFVRSDQHLFKISAQ
ncbi:MAG: PQQ-binding-like beta-propeller repeat protein [Planctomycetales bacterium]|nr:PQQ-binding-like beta-propeller repeat protein [Planctomycetales bacterium]